MRISRAAIAAVAVAAALTVSAVGCSSNPKPTTAPSASSTTSVSPAPSSTQAQPADYTRLLIDAKDINAPEIFTASPPINNPNGQPGVATTFSNQDGSHVIGDTILILPDAAAAAGALDSAKAGLVSSVNGKPVPIDIGTGGTTVSGSSRDGSKGVTVLLFTEGKTFVTLEFDGPPDSLVPPDFVTDVGQKQDTAIKNGLVG
jgi:hypothetical protein